MRLMGLSIEQERSEKAKGKPERGAYPVSLWSRSGPIYCFAYVAEPVFGIKVLHTSVLVLTLGPIDRVSDSFAIPDFFGVTSGTRYQITTEINRKLNRFYKKRPRRTRILFW